MDQATLDFILNVMKNAKDLTIATIRPDGYPQATTVSFVNDDLTIYFVISKTSQKAANIQHNNKVSMTINNDYRDWEHIKGISLGGTAKFVNDPGEIQHATDCMLQRFPQVADWAKSDMANNVYLVRVVPEVISVLDYEKGFGHTELVKVGGFENQTSSFASAV
jgi:general stress protein 26